MDQSYHYSHFTLLSRALQQSIKICIQVEGTGFLCVQIMMPVADGVPLGEHSGILEFKVRSGRQGEIYC
jgi:cell cycle checkpoint protein